MFMIDMMNISFPTGPPPAIPDIFSFFEKSCSLYPELKMLTTSILLNSTVLCLLTSTITSTLMTENRPLIEAMENCGLSASPLQPPLHISNSNFSLYAHSFFPPWRGLLILVALVALVIVVLMPIIVFLRKTTGNHDRLGLPRYLEKNES